MHNSIEVPAQSEQRKGFLIGILYLGVSLVLNVVSQLMLKMAMANLGEFQVGGSSMEYILSMINPMIIGGLLLYGGGTVLWLLCLTKLDISFAYPVSTAQYLLIFWGGWYFFQEVMSVYRIAGLAIICVGVVIISFDYRKQ